MFCAQPFGTPEGVPLQRGYRHCEIALEEKQVLDRILAIRASRDSAGRPDGLMVVFRGIRVRSLRSGKLFPSPAHSVLGVFQKDALLGQLRADSIRARKISCLASLRMFADEALDVGIRKSGGFGQFGSLRTDLVRESFLLRPLDGCTHLSGIVVLQHGEDLLEL